MQYKIDKVQYGSVFGTNQIYYSIIIPISISDSLPDGFYNQYQAIFIFTNDTARGRVSLENPATGWRVQVAGLRIQNLSPTYEVYQFKSGETVQTHVTYNSSGDLYFNMYILNQTGSAITLNTQTINLYVELYDLPVDNVA